MEKITNEDFLKRLNKLFKDIESLKSSMYASRMYVCGLGPAKKEIVSEMDTIFKEEVCKKYNFSTFDNTYNSSHHTSYPLHNYTGKILIPTSKLYYTCSNVWKGDFLRGKRPNGFKIISNHENWSYEHFVNNPPLILPFNKQKNRILEQVELITESMNKDRNILVNIDNLFKRKNIPIDISFMENIANSVEPEFMASFILYMRSEVVPFFYDHFKNEGVFIEKIKDSMLLKPQTENIDLCLSFDENCKTINALFLNEKLEKKLNKSSFSHKLNKI